MCFSFFCVHVENFVNPIEKIIFICCNNFNLLFYISPKSSVTLKSNQSTLTFSRLEPIIVSFVFIVRSLRDTHLPTNNIVTPCYTVKSVLQCKYGFTKYAICINMHTIIFITL